MKRNAQSSNYLQKIFYRHIFNTLSRIIFIASVVYNRYQQKLIRTKRNLKI